MDIRCAVCGEIWESYGITHAIGEGEMTPEQAARFREGEGCLACHFGTVCLRCSGHKFEQSRCPTCFGKGEVLARRMVWESDDAWTFGCLPRVRPCGPATWDIEAKECLEGHYLEGWALCPDCAGTREPCSGCGGTGKMIKVPERDFNTLIEVAEASDRDPMIHFNEWCDVKERGE